MNIRLVSDLHLEKTEQFKEKLKNAIPVLTNEKDSVLVLAGDISSEKEFPSLLEYIKGRFKKVIYIMGNHEFFDSHINREENPFQNIINEYCLEKEIIILDDEFIDIDGYLFWGGTFWLNFNNSDKRVLFHAEYNNSDFKSIRKLSNGSSTRIFPKDILNIHNKSYINLKNFLSTNKDKMDNIIIITHHAPSHCMSNLNSKRYSELSSHSFCNNLDSFIIEHGPKLWLSGHTHFSNIDSVGVTTLIANCSSIQGCESNGFKPDLVISLD